MAIVILYLPFLQAHFAEQRRFGALFELRAVRQKFRRAPIAFGVSLLITLLFAIPLYLLKIEFTPRELLVLPCIVFVVFIYHARLLAGWAMARANRRETPRHFVWRWLVQGSEIPLILAYVLILFITQYTSWSGAWSLLSQPPFLLPAPFVSW